MITFASHQARAGMAGASEDFEQMLGLLVRATSGDANLVFANPGDWGIDVLVGDLRGQVTVWQAKYFTRGVGRRQQAQIAESFASALGASARHGYVMGRWVLCIPASMDGPTTQWWQAWKIVQQRDAGVVIDLWDETRLRELLLMPEAANVRRHYYNPYLHDGRPGLLVPAERDLTVPRHRHRIRRRTVITAAAAAAASAAGLLPAARDVFSGSFPVRQPAWTFPTGVYIACTPVVADGVVYVGDGGGLVHALDAASGTRRWVARAGGTESIFGRPLVTGDTVYVGSSDKRGIHALDTASGRVRWSYSQAGAVYSGITAGKGLVYFGSQDRRVYAVDAVTGHRRWLYRTGGDVQSTPAVAGGQVYFGSEDHFVYALDAATGQFRWKAATGTFILSGPAVVGGRVYIGSGDHNVYALDAVTSGIKWTYPTSAWIWFSSPAVAGDTVYIGSTDGKVYALDAASGHLHWSRVLGGEIAGSPAVSGGEVYIGSTDGKVYALDAATGGIKWVYPTRRAIQSSPAVAGGKVYIGSEDGNIYAFSTSPLPRPPRGAPPRQRGRLARGKTAGSGSRQPGLMASALYAAPALRSLAS